MDAGTSVWSIAVSRDGSWIVSGLNGGHVTVWDAENHKNTIEFRGHKRSVYAVDTSLDGARIATGSRDRTVCVWSLSSGEQLLNHIEHNGTVAAVKFSPDGRRIAAATWFYNSVRIYDSHNGHLLVDTQIRVGSPHNHSLAWAALGKELLALSKDGDIYCIDVATGTTLSKWAIHSSYAPRCIVLANDGTFIAASANSSVSFWDITTHKQIGPLVHHPGHVTHMATSAYHDLMIGGGEKMILQKLPHMLPLSYFHHVCVFSATPDGKGP